MPNETKKLDLKEPVELTVSNGLRLLHAMQQEIPRLNRLLAMAASNQRDKGGTDRTIWSATVCGLLIGLEAQVSAVHDVFKDGLKAIESERKMKENQDAEVVQEESCGS